MFYSLNFNCFYLFLKCFSKRRICKFNLFILLLWSDSNISSPVWNSYLSILPDELFYASLLMLHCSFLSLILYAIFMTSFHFLSKEFFLKCEELLFLQQIFIKIHKVLKFNIWWMIKCNCFKLSFVLSFHNEIVCCI